MKLTVAWNVWNNYLDTALGSEILRRENEQQRFFEALHLISQGGYPDLPSREYAQYLDGHFFVECPEVPLLALHTTKFQGVYRIMEGIQRAYRYAEKRVIDYAMVKIGVAWFLSIEKLSLLLRTPQVKAAAVSMRIGTLSGLQINFGSRVPLFDDHFIILNIPKCTEYGVFEYDHSERFFRPHFGHMGGIHYILGCFVDQRVPPGLFHVYTDIGDTVNHYGDWTGWNILPWQYQLSTNFLHANCAQVPSLDRLRAAFLYDLGFSSYPLVKRYYEEVAPDPHLFTRRHGVLVYKKPFIRAFKEAAYWYSYRSYCALARSAYERQYRRLPQEDIRRKTLYYYDLNKHVKPARLTQ